MNINVFDIIGRSALSMSKGNDLYEVIIRHIKKGEKITLNFENVEMFASLFFNTSIGRLLKDYKPEELSEKVRFENLTPVGKDLLRRSIRNSAEYFSNESVRTAIDKVVPEIEGKDR
ncbi:STAS-like domain-containing protein [Niallia circulans]|uniref:STAS-like domain-containing protein n=1 Tax=Niallia circulans TaxID=1397 RepID=UPI001560D246|nr:STAS-like domain-containing protein [Niallia circulans]NRG34401.1 STAS-like domain-containing protein [Niallia circulans]